MFLRNSSRACRRSTATSKYVFLANIAPDLQRDVLEAGEEAAENRRAGHHELLDRAFERGAARNAASTWIF